MDHDVYEEQMIDMVNRHADESAKAQPKVAPAQESVSAKLMAMTFWRGTKTLILALITVAIFALTANSFLMVGSKAGWWAVVAFLGGIVLLFFAAAFLYALGLVIGRKGESK